MKEIRLYVEGGGDSRSGKDALRRGMGHFLKELREAARKKRIRWYVIACGSRNDAFADFRVARRTYADELVLLLVDSEGPVASTPDAYLSDRDDWEVGPADADVLHLMVEQMESWLVCDADELTAFYGQGFRAQDLPARQDIELVPRADVISGLESATRGTAKGRYKKRHGLEAIARIRPTEVRGRATHCDRLFETIQDRIGEA